MLKYIELKSGQGDCGPAWIADVKQSKSGQTVYFNGMALKKNHGRGVSGNHYDWDTGDEYWVSGVKKNGTDRHWAGGGLVLVERAALKEYLALRGICALNPRTHKVTDDIQPTDIPALTEAENAKFSE